MHNLVQYIKTRWRFFNWVVRQCSWSSFVSKDSKYISQLWIVFLCWGGLCLWNCDISSAAVLSYWCCDCTGLALQPSRLHSIPLPWLEEASSIPLQCRGSVWQELQSVSTESQLELPAQDQRPCFGAVLLCWLLPQPTRWDWCVRRHADTSMFMWREDYRGKLHLSGCYKSAVGKQRQSCVKPIHHISLLSCLNMDCF